MNRRNITRSIALVVLAAIAPATLASTTTYDFTQTVGFLGRVKGSITMENGIFMNQEAVNALNNAQYSINLINVTSPEVWTFTPDNSQWSFYVSPRSGTTITLRSDNTALELTGTVLERCDLTVINDTFKLETNGGGYTVFGYLFHVYPPITSGGVVDFYRQGVYGDYSSFSYDDFHKTYMCSFGQVPTPVQFTYRYPAIVSNLVGEIEVSPISYNFGNVKWAQTSTASFTILNVGGGPLTLSKISLSDSSGVFSITSPLPTTLAANNSATVEVTFNPKAIQTYTGSFLNIESDDTDESSINIPLSGIGVLTDTPSEQVAAIVDYIQKAIASGELTGVGEGSSATHKVQALINMIQSAGDLLAGVQTVIGCQQLADVYLKVNGVSFPPDFVTGPATAGLVSAIQGMMTYYGCQ